MSSSTGRALSRLDGYVTWRWLATTALAILAMAGGLGAFVLEAHSKSPHPGAASRAELQALERISSELRHAILQRLDRIEAKLDRR
ncbi:MAG: hypothetical protein ACE5F1_01460 [Planctomycetota bacterium]